MARLTALNYRAAIIGPEGSGKTTLLEDLEPRLRARGFQVRWLRITMEDRHLDHRLLADVQDRDVFLMDGADLLARTLWLWVRFNVRRAAGLIVTSRRLRVLPRLIECQTSEPLLGEIANELLGEKTVALRHLFSPLFNRHNGNLRCVLRELYDVCARQ